jgi:putative phosphonate metabolism protein
MAARYAVYYAPSPDSALWSFGSRVLGYDAATGEACVPLVPAGFEPGHWARVTAEPRRYGFHGTLKAPFALAKERSEAELRAAMSRFAEAQQGFSLALSVCRLGSFIALTPMESAPEIGALADGCVEAFEAFRAPLGPEARARRLAAELTDRQRDHLDRWGYPYVFQDFRFHMTLTGPLADEEAERARAGLADFHAAGVSAGQARIDAIALFADPGEGRSFRILERFPFGA